jgi:hypothetical protein
MSDAPDCLKARRDSGLIRLFGTERGAVVIGDADPAHLPLPEWIDQWQAAWDAGHDVTTCEGARLT